jgi:cysteine desulfurase/selenocysteine lyase
MKEIRKDFPFFEHNKELIYLDSAATAQKPHIVLDALHSFYAYHNAPINRGMYHVAEEATVAYEQVRVQTARFINAASEHCIAFTYGTTDGINRAVRSYGVNHVKMGDSLVITELEHHANMVPWMELSKEKGAQLRYLSVGDDWLPQLDCIEKTIDKTTKMVGITLSSNVIGDLPSALIKKVINAAHAVGAVVLLDAAQWVPHHVIDVTALDADFVVYSAHKLGGPGGVGVLYVHPRLHAVMPPVTYGGGMVFDVTLQSVEYKPFPYSFEVGSMPVGEVLAMGKAQEYLQQAIGFKALEQHEQLLCAVMVDGLLHNCSGRIQLLGQRDKQCGHVLSFLVDEIHPHDVAAYLDHHHVAVRAGMHCARPIHQKFGLSGSVRLSLYAYTTFDEIEHTVGLLAKLCQEKKR